MWSIYLAFLGFLLAPIAIENKVLDPNKTRPCAKQSRLWKEHYSQLDFHIPQANQAVITIHCNLIIWQDDEGLTNFQDTPEDRNRLYNLFHHPTMGLNFQFYERYIPPTDPIIPAEAEVQNKNIRFQLDSLVFIKSSKLTRSIGIGDKRRYLETNGYQELLHQLNINVTTSSGPMAGAWGHAEYPSSTGSIPMITTTDNPNQKSYSGSPTKADPNYPVSRATFDGENYYRDWSFMEHIAHELGHCLDLKHVYAGAVGAGYEDCDYDNHDYMPDIFPADAPWCKQPRNGCDVCLQYSDDIAADVSPNDGRTNNLMNGRGGRYLSPKQLGKIHRALATTTIGKAATGFSPIPLVVDSNQTWDFPLQLYQPIRVRKGVTLTISCNVKLPPEGFVRLDSGAKLIIDGGSLSGSDPAQPTNWKGIKMRKRKRNPATVESVNDGKLLVLPRLRLR